jgi:Ca-activated chloride channel family protein
MAMRLVTLVCVVALALAASGSSLGQNAPGVHVELILDASGSMFNKLGDGRYRIVAAKEALSDLIASLPAGEELNVGLRVYGSRTMALEEGACLDSELMVPLDGVQRRLLLDTVRDSQARGATPIALSLERALADFPADGHRAIVLVTDGEESCSGDVRAIAERLRAAGIDLHIVGFDLDDAAVRSFEGLGSFENARSGSELAAALARAVQVAPAEELYRVTVTLTREGEPTTEGASVSFVGADQDSFRFEPTADGTLVADLPAGRYEASVADAFSEAPEVVAGLAVLPEGENLFAFELAPEAQVELQVEPGEPNAGSRVTVSYRGAPAKGSLVLAPADAPDDAYLDWREVDASDGEAELTVPDEPGTFETRYLVYLPEGGTRVIGRSQAFTSLAVSASLSAPEEVPAGGRFDVDWEGPDNPGDYVTIVPTGSPPRTYESFFDAEDGTPGTLTASDEPGQYEIRYVTGQAGQTLVTVTVTVTPVSATVSAPREVPAGGRFQVDWQGPDNQGDYVTIVPAGSPPRTYKSYFDTSRGTPGTLTASDEPGEYEVRYVTGQAGETLASTPLTVTPVSASLSAPADVEAGTDFTVEWEGPDNPNDYITIVPAGSPEGSYESYFYTSGGTPGTLTAPDDAGNYEVRYVLGQSEGTLTAARIRVR